MKGCPGGGCSSKREKAVPAEDDGGARWPVDQLFVDQNGVPTLVEVKRQTDTRLRREVVGQMLDYAANAVVYWPIDQLHSEFEASCAQQSADPPEETTRHLGADIDPETLRQQIKTNLQAGRIRMLFVADRIPPELRRIVEFLNQQMNPAEVLALELRHFAGEGSRRSYRWYTGRQRGRSRRRLLEVQNANGMRNRCLPTLRGGIGQRHYALRRELHNG
jgi:hypothetical protein